MRAVILSARAGGHTSELLRALAERGHSGDVRPYEGLVATLGNVPVEAGLQTRLTGLTRLTSDHTSILDADAVFARIIPGGSLEQIIYRVDALHWIENRGVLAAPDTGRGALTVWGSTQVPHWLQRTLMEVLDWPAHRVRVIAPDVGGGFGTKCSLYAEDVLIPLLAVRLGQPVKWIETRREHLASASHSA